MKGKYNYPRTVVGVLKYLQFHSLHGNQENLMTQQGKKHQIETAFVTDGDPTPPGTQNQQSKMCCKWQKDECPYKEERLWSECPSNEYSQNKDKKINDKGELILCTVQETEETMMAYNDDDLDVSNVIDSEDKIGDEFHFYLPLLFTYKHRHYTFCKLVR